MGKRREVSPGSSDRLPVGERPATLGVGHQAGGVGQLRGGGVALVTAQVRVLLQTSGENSRARVLELVVVSEEQELTLCVCVYVCVRVCV